VQGANQGLTLILLPTIGLTVIIATPNTGDGVGGGDLTKAYLRSQNLLLALMVMQPLMCPLMTAIAGTEEGISVGVP
jgi:hypothetical protein